MRRRSLALLLLATGAVTAFAAEKAAALDAETAAKFNPFKPAASAGAPVAANETIEFAGVSQLGKTTHLIFHDKTAKKNRWVGIGETVEGISAIRYDERLEQAVVKINGVQKTLPLRKGTGPVNSPVGVAVLPAAAGFNVPPPPAPQLQPLPAPVTAAPAIVPVPVDPAAQNAAPKPPAPNTPEAQVKAETEARMLVSDLLEIGMAQRKAYEEAQRRAAEGKSGQPPVEQNAPAQPKQ